tara:strand:- start:5211 stop:5597 length:387 start_codon:yes stop_codon:yes gene_type:complete
MINNNMATIFKGFSTVDKIRAPYSLFDQELIKRDLLNEFYTRKGERLMKPNFGCIIWDLLMEPEDTITEDEIRDDITRIVDKDPRVDIQDIVLYTADHTVRAEVLLRYVQSNNEDILYLEFLNNNENA